jgi:hypothetical protein
MRAADQQERIPMFISSRLALVAAGACIASLAPVASAQASSVSADAHASVKLAVKGQTHLGQAARAAGSKAADTQDLALRLEARGRGELTIAAAKAMRAVRRADDAGRAQANQGAVRVLKALAAGQRAEAQIVRATSGQVEARAAAGARAEAQLAKQLTVKISQQGQASAKAGAQVGVLVAAESKREEQTLRAVLRAGQEAQREASARALAQAAAVIVRAQQDYTEILVRLGEEHEQAREQLGDSAQQAQTNTVHAQRQVNLSGSASVAVQGGVTLGQVAQAEAQAALGLAVRR